MIITALRNISLNKDRRGRGPSPHSINYLPSFTSRPNVPGLNNAYQKITIALIKAGNQNAIHPSLTRPSGEFTAATIKAVRKCKVRCFDSCDSRMLVLRIHTHCEGPHCGHRDEEWEREDDHGDPDATP